MYESETNEIERRWKQGSQTFYPKAIEILLARIHWLEEAAQQSVQADLATDFRTALIPCPHCGVNVTIDSDMLPSR